MQPSAIRAAIVMMTILLEGDKVLISKARTSSVKQLACYLCFPSMNGVGTATALHGISCSLLQQICLFLSMVWAFGTPDVAIDCAGKMYDTSLHTDTLSSSEWACTR